MLTIPAFKHSRLRVFFRAFVVSIVVTLAWVAMEAVGPDVAFAKVTANKTTAPKTAVKTPAPTTSTTSKVAASKTPVSQVVTSKVAAPISIKPATSTKRVDSAVLYTVKKGETLSSIAAKNKLSVGGIATINAISNVHKITAGKQILIPVNAAKAPAQQQSPAKVTTQTVKLPDVGSFAPSPGGPLPAKLQAAPERKKLQPQFVAAGREFRVPVDLLEAMTWNESGWQNKVVSSTGARGIGQLMPATIEFVNADLLSKPLDPNRPEHNIRMSAAFLRYLLNETNEDSRLALAAYYQGLNSIRTKGLYNETTQYVRTVIAVQKNYF